MKIFWTGASERDREQIRLRIHEDNPRAAISLDLQLRAKAELLIGNPLMGRPGRRKGTRELVAHPSYLLIYDVSGRTIRILRVMHTARQWPPRR